MADIIWKNVEKLAVKNVSALIVNCEYDFDRQIYAIADGIFNNKNVNIVLIAGPSASGKTTSCNLLAERLEFLGINSNRISTDDYFLDRDRIPFLSSGVQDFDSIGAINLTRLQQDIRSLLAGQSVRVPRYDFNSGKSIDDGGFIEMSPADVVIIEGLHALNPMILAGCGDISDRIKKISIAPRRSFIMENGAILKPDDLRLLRRLIRDYYTRNHSFEATIKQWDAVLEAEKKYIAPYVGLADYFIDSVYDYELIVYKQCIYEQIKNSYLDKIQIINRVLADVNSMHIASIPTASLLNEFANFGELKCK